MTQEHTTKAYITLHDTVYKLNGCDRITHTLTKTLHLSKSHLIDYLMRDARRSFYRPVFYAVHQLHMQAPAEH